MDPDKLKIKVNASQHCNAISVENISDERLRRIALSTCSLKGGRSDAGERQSIQVVELYKGVVRNFFLSKSHAPNLGFSFIMQMMLYMPSAYAQSTNAAPPDGGIKPFPSESWLTSREIVVSACVLFFGLAMTVIASRMLSRSRVPVDDIIRLFALVIIVTGVLFLVAAGYSATDIAPSMGLLGTIAGYILGRTSRAGTLEGQDNSDAQSRGEKIDNSTASLGKRGSTESPDTEHPTGSQGG